MKTRLPHRLVPLAMAWLAIFLAAICSQTQGAPGPFLVRSWQSEDGLPSNVVRALAQTSDGYLWVATAEGVERFDGARFSSFPREEDALLAQRPPRALFAMPEGDLWISTARGGLLHWNGRGQFREVWGDAESSVAEIIVVASDGRGGAVIQRGDQTFHSGGGAPLQRIEATPEIAALLRSAEEEHELRSSTAPAGKQLQLRDSKGRLWVATPGQGLAVSTSDDSGTSVALPDFGPGISINALLEGREGNIWVATGGNGLFQIRPRRVEVFGVADGLRDRAVFALLEDRSGALWAANKSGGIDRIANGNVTHFEVGDGGANRPVSALCEDRDGVLWAAARNGSVFRLEGGAFRLATNSAMPVSKVLAMATDSEGRMWFGGQQGIASWDGTSLTRYGAEHGVPAQNITALAIGADDAIWAGAADGAIYHGSGGRFTRLGVAGSRAISAFLPEKDGSAWITTLGSGLFRWMDGRFARFAEAEGLPDARLTCVLEDGSGNLWLGSLAGIVRAAKTQLSEIAAGKREGADWLVLDRSDGMLSRECTGAFQPAGWRGRDGRLYFPTVNGIASFHPDRLELNAIPPPVVIEEARANGRRAAEPVSLLNAGPGRSRLEFRYTALSFTAPSKVRFRVLLEELEGSTWRDVGSQRTIAFESVPPGRYRFHARAANGDGVWNETGASLAVEVEPRVWETGWFRAAVILLAALLATGLGWAVARARMRGRLLRMELQSSREKERARIAQDLHDDLGASLTEISMLAHLAAEDEARDGGKEALPEIATKTRDLVGALDEIVWAVNPRHDTVASLADYLAAFAAEFLETAGISLRLGIPRDLPALPLNAEQRHSLFLAAREALNNTVKHSGATEARLEVKIDGGWVRVTIQDNGRGLGAEAGAFSEGLRGMRERLSRIGGTCEITSSESGTRVELGVPVAEGRS